MEGVRGSDGMKGNRESVGVGCREYAGGEWAAIEVAGELIKEN